MDVTTEVALELKATTNYDTDVWANRSAVVVLPLGLSWLCLRMANKRAVCEAQKHGYWEQRKERLKGNGPGEFHDVAPLTHGDCPAAQAYKPSEGT